MYSCSVRQVELESSNLMQQLSMHKMKYKLFSKMFE